MDNHENGFVDQLVERKSVDPICMIDDILYFQDLPKYNQYDDDYVVEIDTHFSKQSTTCLWEEEFQLQQLKYRTHHMHINHENNEENAENFKARERSLPLCFTSFQLLRENFPKIRNQQSFIFYVDHGEDYEIIDHDSLHLCFSSFERIR